MTVSFTPIGYADFSNSAKPPQFEIINRKEDWVGSSEIDFSKVKVIALAVFGYKNAFVEKVTLEEGKLKVITAYMDMGGLGVGIPSLGWIHDNQRLFFSVPKDIEISSFDNVGMICKEIGEYSEEAGREVSKLKEAPNRERERELENKIQELAAPTLLQLKGLDLMKSQSWWSWLTSRKNYL